MHSGLRPLTSTKHAPIINMSASGSITSDNPRKRIKCSPPSRSPQADFDPYVTIHVDENGQDGPFRLLKKDLRRGCKFFELYPEDSFPNEFSIQETRGDLNNSYLIPQPPNQNSGIRARSFFLSFAVVFEVLCQMENEHEPETIADAAKLAADLECSEEVKKMIKMLFLESTRVYMGNLETVYLHEALEVAYHLQDERFFRYLVPYAVKAGSEVKSSGDLPEIVQYVIKMEEAAFLKDATGKITYVLGTLESMEEYLVPDCHDHLTYDWLRRTFILKKEEARDHRGCTAALQFLKQCVDGGIFEDHESLAVDEEQVTALKNAIQRCYTGTGLEEECFKVPRFMGLLPWALNG